jgi:tRNA pseudouridine55 synthase
MLEKLTAEDFQEGRVLLFDKPYGWTSFDLVNKVRSTIRHFFELKKIKVGHAGTLDPLATGLLIICTGKATKSISSFQDLKKEYIATIEFGKTTPSFDLETEFDASFNYDHITRVLIQKMLQEFLGEIEQIPPIFSAKQIGGARAYKFARQGKEKILEPVKIRIDSIEIVHFSLPELIIKIVCSKGTYIRSIAHDLGKKLNSGAYLKDLKRTAIGDYKNNDAISPEDFQKNLTIIKQN